MKTTHSTVMNCLPKNGQNLCSYIKYDLQLIEYYRKEIRLPTTVSVLNFHLIFLALQGHYFP
jgi:hypothetical protein